MLKKLNNYFKNKPSLLMFEITLWVFKKSQRNMIYYGKLLGTKDKHIDAALKTIASSREMLTFDASMHKLKGRTIDLITDSSIYCEQALRMLKDHHINIVRMKSKHKSIIQIAIDENDIYKAVNILSNTNKQSKKISIFPKKIHKNFRSSIEVIFFDETTVLLNTVISIEIWRQSHNMYSTYPNCDGIQEFECGVSGNDSLRNKPILELKLLQESLPASVLKIGDKFKIDIVYTWVTNDDAAWRKKRRKYINDSTTNHGDISEARFRQNNELLYSMRSIQSYFPYFNTIYIVTDSQIPAWLDTSHEKITVIDHTDIFDNPSDLPTFNSRAIELHLHKIQGLHEHFIYFNDDVLLWNPCVPEDFFTSSGQSKSFLEQHSIPLLAQSALHPGYFNASNNSRRLLLDEGIGAYLNHRHTPFALRKSVLEELWEKYRNELTLTSASHTRSTNNYQIIRLYQYFSITSRRAVKADIIDQYIATSDANFTTRMTNILNDKTTRTLCINDTENESTGNHIKMKEILESKFPVKINWEK